MASWVQLSDYYLEYLTVLVRTMSSSSKKSRHTVTSQLVQGMESKHSLGFQPCLEPTEAKEMIVTPGGRLWSF